MVPVSAPLTASVAASVSATRALAGPPAAFTMIVRARRGPPFGAGTRGARFALA